VGSGRGCRGCWAPEMPTDKGQTGPLGDEVDLRPVLASEDRIRAGQVPLFRRPYVHRVDRTSRPVQLASGAEFVQDQAVQLGPDPGLGPLGEPAMSRRPGRPELCGGQLLPRPSRCRQEHDGASTSRSPCRRRPPPCGRNGACVTTRRNNSHNFRHQPLNDPCHDQQPTQPK
jgi:hypothetical protein